MRNRHINGASMKLPSLLLSILIALPSVSFAGLSGENLLQNLPSGYKVDFQDKQGNIFTTEIVPQSESVNDWTEMVTTQVFYGLKIPALEHFQVKAAELWLVACKEGMVAPVTKGEENGYSFLVWRQTCPMLHSTGKPENTWVKAIKGNDSLYVIQKAFRFEPSKKQIDQWIDYFHTVIVCDTRFPEHPCSNLSSDAPPPMVADPHQSSEKGSYDSSVGQTFDMSGINVFDGWAYIIDNKVAIEVVIGLLDERTGPVAILQSLLSGSIFLYLSNTTDMPITLELSSMQLIGSSPTSSKTNISRINGVYEVPPRSADRRTRRRIDGGSVPVDFSETKLNVIGNIRIDDTTYPMLLNLNRLTASEAERYIVQAMGDGDLPFPNWAQSSFYFTRGTEALAAKRYVEAVRYLEKAVVLDATLSRNHNNLAAAYFEVGEVRDGWPHVRMAVALDPTNQYAKQNFFRYFAAMVNLTNLQNGDSYETVREKLGSPDGVAEETEQVWWQYGHTALAFKAGLLSGVANMGVRK
jgi:hypothetical protein